MTSPAFLVTAVALTTLLASCGASGGGDPATPTSGIPSIAETPTDCDSAVAVSARLQTAENSGAWDLVLEDVRAAEHEGFDRIVLQFVGTGTPGWAVHYVEEAVLDGSGDVVPLGGDAILQLDVSGTPWPPPGDDSRPEQVEPATGGAFVDVHVGGPFEGYTQVFAGIDGRRAPFRVFALTAPSRLVVDVVRGGADCA